MDTQTDKTGTQTKNNPHWLDILDEHKVKVMAVDPLHDTKLIEQLQTRLDWTVEFACGEAIFFVREEMPESS